jgi:hypothetical protein
MVSRKRKVASGHRRVWRVTADAPQGEYVDPDKLPLPVSSPTERPEPGWMMSSFELTHGLDVTDETDTLPGELFDELFKKA